MGQVPAQAWEYAAFLSYSRAIDGKLAPALQRALEQFAKPWHSRRALRVFRDEGSLSANSDLTRSIVEGLDASEFFILLASPNAAESTWVHQEVDRWLQRNGTGKLIVAVTDGQIGWSRSENRFDSTTNCIPKVLDDKFDAEPRWVDLRSVRAEQHLTLDVPNFRDKVADLAAPLHHRPKDDLIGEDIREHRKVRRLVVSAVAGLTVLAVVAGAAAVVAKLQADNATRQRGLAETRQQLAEQRLRHGTSRQLIAQADAVGTTDPRQAARLGLAAWGLEPDAASRASLVRTITGTLIDTTLVGSDSGFASMAVAPNGKLLAAGNQSGEILFWSLPDRRPINPVIQTQERSVSALAFSADGRRLATAGLGRIELVDTSDPTNPAQASAISTEPPDWVASVAISPDGKTLAAAYGDRTQLWDISDARTPAALGPPLISQTEELVRQVAFTPGGATLITNQGKALEFWNVTNPARPTRLRPPLPTDGGLSMAISADGHTLALGTEDIALWDIASPGQPRAQGVIPTGTFGIVHSLAFAPDGRTLAGGADDSTVHLWDVTNRARPRQIGAPLIGHSASVTAVSFAPDGALASGSADATVIVWRPSPRGAARRLGLPFSQDGIVTGLAWSPDGRTLTSALANQTVLTWDVANGTKPLRRGARRAGYPSFVALAPDGRTLATSGGESASVLIWDASDSVRPIGIGAHEGKHADQIFSAAFSPDGRTLATAGKDYAITLWDVTDRSRPSRLWFTDDNEVTNALAFSPDGRTLATGGDSHAMILWDLTDRAHPQPKGSALTGHTGAVTSIAFSPDGQTMASASLDHTVRLWRVSDRTSVGEPLAAHRSAVSSVAFSPDGRTLASAGYDQTVRLWDVADRTSFGEPLTGHKGPVLSVTFAPDGTTLATGGYDRTIQLWQIPPMQELFDDPVELACTIAGRALLNDEWTFYAPDIPYVAGCG